MKKKYQGKYTRFNLGFFCSILKVTGPDEFSRISGTSVSVYCICNIAYFNWIIAWWWYFMGINVIINKSNIF